MAAATTISLTSIATPSNDILNATAIGGAVEGSPDGQTFLKPIQIVLPYTDALVPAGTDVATARILMAPQGSTNFTAVDSTVDQATHTVHATTTHFTTFVPTVPTLSSGDIVLTNVTPSSVIYSSNTGGYTRFTVTGSNLPLPHAWADWDGPGDGSQENVSVVTNTSTSADVVVGADVAGKHLTLGTHKLRLLRLDPDTGTILAASNALDITIVPPPSAPTLTTVTPNTTATSVYDLPIHLVGTDFTSAAKVRAGTTDLPTTFISTTALDAVMPGRYLNSGSSISLTVFTPAPGGGTSNAITLTVQRPSGPVLTAIKPQTIAPGSAAFTLQVSTSTTVPANSKIVFGSTELATTISTASNSYGEVASATVPASLVTTAGRIPVSVVDPATGTSNLRPFEVMGGLPCNTNNVDLDGDSGNGCETDLSSGPVCVTLRRDGYCFASLLMEHPAFWNHQVEPNPYITTDSVGLSQLFSSTPKMFALFTQEGSTSIWDNTSFPGSQLDTSTGQLIFSGSRFGGSHPPDWCPLGEPPEIQVHCQGTVTFSQAP